MKKYCLLFITTALLFTFACPAHAQSSRVITLNDGTVIKGVIAGTKDGIYTIKTSHMGTVQIKDADIYSISANNESVAQRLQKARELENKPSAGNSQFKNQMEQIQGNVLTDPELMNDIQGLTENEEIMSILSDETLVNDVMSFDPQKIQNNPKLQKLMQNPEMQAVMEKVNQKMAP